MSQRLNHSLERQNLVYHEGQNYLQPLVASFQYDSLQKFNISRINSHCSVISHSHNNDDLYVLDKIVQKTARLKIDEAENNI